MKKFLLLFVIIACSKCFSQRKAYSIYPKLQYDGGKTYFKTYNDKKVLINGIWNAVENKNDFCFKFETGKTYPLKSESGVCLEFNMYEVKNNKKSNLENAKTEFLNILIPLENNNVSVEVVKSFTENNNPYFILKYEKTNFTVLRFIGCKNNLVYTACIIDEEINISKNSVFLQETFLDN
jgi:hypothetical protein